MSRFLTVLNATPLADGQQWRLNQPLYYQSALLKEHDDGNDLIIVPARFITDYASIPQMLRNALPAWNVYGPAAVVHDFLYFSQTLPRDVCDSILREACRVLAVPEMIIMAIYLGVREGGQEAWDTLARLKATGYTRMASLNDLPPFAAP